MSSAANTESAPVAASASERATAFPLSRQVYWSVRRELWEHRAVWMAPLIASAVVLVGFLLSTSRSTHGLQQLAKQPPMSQMMLFSAPFLLAGGAIMATGFIVAVFYCLSALNNERRDRSILFWKSLPVSDVTTVLSKAIVPFVILPIVVFVVAVVTQFILLLLGSGILVAAGLSPADVWGQLPLPGMLVTLAYLSVICALWNAPIYGWLFMVSSWARRVAFLWAILPWLGLMLIEKIGLDTNYVARLIGYRLNGAIQEGFTELPHRKNMVPADVTSAHLISWLDPEKFFTSPGLWLGFVAFAVFMAAAVWFRRMRDPG